MGGLRCGRPGSGGWQGLGAAEIMQVQFLAVAFGKPVTVAAFFLDGQTDLLAAPAAQASHFTRVLRKRFRQLHWQPRLWWGVLLLPLFFTCPSGAGLSLDSGLVVFSSGTVVKYTLKKHPRILLFLRPPGFDPGGFRRGQC